MWLLIMLAGIIILVVLWIRCVVAEKNYVRFTASEGYSKLQPLLRACKIINRKYPVREIRFDEYSNSSIPWYRCSVHFQGLGAPISSICKMLYEVDKKVEQNYNLDVSRRTIIIIGPEQIKPACERATQTRTDIQSKADNTFYTILFDNDEALRKTIRSPFECYSSSGGRYIIDNDLWETAGDTAIYKCLFNFNGLSKAAMPALLKKLLKDYFPNSVASQSQFGCQIRNL